MVVFMKSAKIKEKFLLVNLDLVSQSHPVEIRRGTVLLALLWTGGILAAAPPARAWGQRGHRVVDRIARDAIRADAPRRGPAARAVADLLERNSAFFVREADLADRIRAVDGRTAPHHYLDAEDFGGRAAEGAATTAGGLAFLRNLPPERPHEFDPEMGDLPWHLGSLSVDFRRALRAGDRGEALRLAALIGHFVGDAHVPLHSTRDYNGRDEGSRGIHARWESETVESMNGLDRLPPAPRRDFTDRLPRRGPGGLPGPAGTDAELAARVREAAARFLLDSHRLVEKVYEGDARARRIDPDLGPAYLAEMRRRQGPMIRGRLSSAGRALAEILLLAAQDAPPGRGTAESDGERRIDLEGVEGGEETAAFRMRVSLLGNARGESAVRLAVVGLRRDRIGERLARTSLFLPTREGDSTESVVEIRRSRLRGLREIEIRLDPPDRLSPEDDRLRVSRREWVQERPSRRAASRSTRPD